MRIPISLFCTFGALALAPALCQAWLGVKPRSRPAQVEAPAEVPAQSAPAAKSAAAKPVVVKPIADTTPLYRTVTHIPARTRGRYLGTLEGVRCFNCAPGEVMLNLGDSISGRAAIVSLRIEAWNSVERPLKDRRMFDYGNKCFYFGFKEIDTAFVGGEWTEIRVQDVPCYPYVRRAPAPALTQSNGDYYQRRPPMPTPAAALAAKPAAEPAGAPVADEVAPPSGPRPTSAPAEQTSKPHQSASFPQATQNQKPAPAYPAQPSPSHPPIDVVLEPTID